MLTVNMQCDRHDFHGLLHSAQLVGAELRRHLAPLGIPSFVGANIGHHRGQLSLPHGGDVEIDADARTIELKRPIVR